MHVPFETLPNSARLWIYQASRKFNSTEFRTISESLSAFTNQWAAHGNPLQCSFKIEHDQFVIVCVDENYNGASGCSIDASTHVFKKLEQGLGIRFFDRTDVAFLIDNQVQLVPMKDLAKALHEGVWNSDTSVFNNMIQLKGDMNNWIVPAGQTWLKRYLTKVTAF